MRSAAVTTSDKGSYGPLTGQSQEFKVVRMAQIGRLNVTLTGPISLRTPSNDTQSGQNRAWENDWPVNANQEPRVLLTSAILL